jgi:hypothetical protein
LWRVGIETAVRSVFILVPPPRSNDYSCGVGGAEPLHIHTRVAHVAIEAFTVRILPWAARCTVGGLHRLSV